MKDFITEAWLRANHTLSEGAEIHLPADARLTPSARELLESRHLRIKFIDEQGSLFIDDEQQQPQPVHGLTSSDTHPQASCELCHQPVAKKPDTLTHLTADKMVAKSDPRLGFRAALDSTIALAVWLQIELAEPWQPWLADIRSRLGNNNRIRHRQNNNDQGDGQKTGSRTGSSPLSPLPGVFPAISLSRL